MIPKNVIANTAPIKKIKRACMSSGLSRLAGLIVDPNKVFSTNACSFALGRVALGLFPVFIILARIAHPPVITTAH